MDLGRARFAGGFGLVVAGRFFARAFAFRATGFLRVACLFFGAGFCFVSAEFFFATAFAFRATGFVRAGVRFFLTGFAVLGASRVLPTGLGLLTPGFLFATGLFATGLFATGFFATGFFFFALAFGFAMTLQRYSPSLAIGVCAGHRRSVTLDLDAYLDRIGWRGPLVADFATVAGLLHRHVIAIPFENLDVLLGRPPRLDLASLQDKLVRSRRGGYCYEHTTLFAAVLQHLGFAITPHSARVTLLLAKAAAPRTHMFLTVALPEGTFVLDPGFGGMTPRVPVPTDGTPVQCGTDQFRLVRDGEDHALEVHTPEKTVTAWVSPLARDYPVDFEMANHFTATHPTSPFTQRLMLRAFTDDGRITIVNRDVTRFRGTTSETVKLLDRKVLRDTLVTHFGFDLDVDALRVPMIPEWT